MSLMPPGPSSRLPFARRRSTRFPVAGALIPPPRGRHRIGVVLHPAKKQSQTARDLLRAHAATAGWAAPRFYETTIESPGQKQTRQALDDGCDLLVVCGGDGTVRLVAEELRHTRIPLGILPIGTGNVFARNLLLPQRNLSHAAGIALHGAAAAIDLGVATTTTKHGRQEHVFLVLAGIGNDAATALATRPHLKESVGWLAYMESAARHAWNRPVGMVLHYPANPPREIKAWSVVIGNCGKVPGGIAVFPGAVIDDGILDILEVTVDNPLQWLPIGAKGLLHLRAAMPGLRHTYSPSLVVVPLVPEPVQVDGDVITEVTRLEAGIDHRAVVVRIPTPVG